MRTHGRLATYQRGCRCGSCLQAGERYRRRGLPADDPRHGSTNAYNNFGCRCELCRVANAAAFDQAKASHVARGSLPPGDARHGSTNGYGNWGCRCTDCRAAHAAAKQARVERKKAPAHRREAVNGGSGRAGAAAS